MRNIQSLILLVGCSIILLPAQLKGQKTVDSLCQTANLEMLRTLNNYALNARLGKYQKDKFERLFVNSNVMVANDYIPLNDLNDSLPLQQYMDMRPRVYSKLNGVKVMPKYITSISFNRNYTKGTAQIIGDKIIGRAKIRNDKTQFVLHDTFNLIFNFQIELTDKGWIAKIGGIEMAESRGKYQGIVVQINPKKEVDTIVSYKLESDDILYELNERNQVLLKNQIPGKKKKFEITNKNVLGKRSIVIASDDQSKSDPQALLSKLTYRKQRVSVKFGYGLHLFANDGPHYSNSELITSDYKGNDINLEIGYSLNSNNQLLINKYDYWQIKTGLYYTSISYLSSMKSWIHENASIDDDDDTYLRTSELSNIQESNTLTMLGIPLILEKGFDFTRKKNTGFGAFLNGGLLFSLPLNHTYSSTARASYSGTYEQYYNVVIAENGNYDFGDYDISGSGELPIAKNLFYVLVTGGAQYYFSKRVVAHTGLQYRRMSGSLIESASAPLSNNKEELNSLVIISKSSQLNYVMFDFGFTIRL